MENVEQLLYQLSLLFLATSTYLRPALLYVKGIGTKAPFNGGFAFAWLSTKLCVRLQRPDFL